MLGRQEDMTQLYEGVTLHEFETSRGHELGLVRISLGLATSFQDVWRVITFAATLGSELHRQILWDRWKGLNASALGHGNARKQHQVESWKSGESSSGHDSHVS